MKTIHMIDLNSKFGRVAKQHLQDEYFVWLTTVDLKLAPQPRPVWFVWEAGSFLIFSQPHAHKVAHIRKNPKVALHFNADETGDQHVIVFVGEAIIDDKSLPAYQVPTYFRKYEDGIAGLKMTPEEFSHDYSVAIKIRPTHLRGWE